MILLKQIGYGLTIFFTLLLNPIFSQDYQNSDSQYALNQSQHITKRGFGLNLPSYRDFATSPLFYSGVGVLFQTDWLRIKETTKSNFYLGSSLNFLTADIPTGQILDPNTTGFLFQFTGGYNHLWKLKSLSNDKFSFMLGGDAKITQNIRINPSLLNSSTGFENFINVGFAGEVSRDISRHVERNVDLPFYKKTFKPIRRDLRFGLTAGILNFNYRPGYAYLYEDERDGTIVGFNEAFSGYSWSFNGWNLGTEIEYIIRPTNDNGYSWTYSWNATNAPGKYDKFEMANHLITYSRYINKSK